MKEYRQIQDVYKFLKNPQKFKGRRPITMRSSWEIEFVLKFLDINPSVLEWKSEDIIIYYTYDIDKKIHRYFPDFWVKIINKDKEIKQMLIEIKPQKDLQIAKNKKNFETYIKNQNKFESAKKYAEINNMEFVILTEKELF